MLRHRIIPVVLINGYSVLKTIKFDVRRNLGSPVTVARTYNTRNVDELILLDIDASKERRSIDKFTIMDIAEELFMPLTVGGGIRTVEDIRIALSMGADKVAINSRAFDNPDIVKDGAAIFGKQCIVVSIDVKKIAGTYQIYHHATNATDGCPFEWIKKVEILGAGEILLNSVDQDGEMKGVDEELFSAATKIVKIPIIGCGGVATPEDSAIITRVGVSAVAAASIFHFTGYTPNDCKVAMAKAGFFTRELLKK